MYEFMFRRENGYLCHVDEGIEDFFGWTAEEVKAHTIAALVTPSSHTALQEIYLQGPPNRYGLRILSLDAYHKDGHIVPVRMSAICRYDKKGMLVASWGSIRHAPRQREQDKLLAWWSEAATKKPEALDAVIHLAEAYAAV